MTGGAGYIGTQTCKALKEAGFQPIIYDNFSRSQDIGLKWGIVEKGDISDRKRLSQVIDKHKPVAAIHFAGFKAVGESIKDPVVLSQQSLRLRHPARCHERKRAQQNHLLEHRIRLWNYGGEPALYVEECALHDPINPYGTSKWMVEKILHDFNQAYGFHYVIFRYFNVAGADLQGECGERGSSPNNLVPIILQVAAEKRKELEVFGSNYPARKTELLCCPRLRPRRRPRRRPRQSSPL